MLVPVILAGGSGSRLWPLSRAQYPKQLQSLLSERSMLQETVLRALFLESVSQVVIITHSDLRFLVAEHVEQLRREIGFAQQVDIIIESQAYGTAAAIALAGHFLAASDVMWVMSADHYVEDDAVLCQSIIEVVDTAKNHLISLGVAPTSPDTGYGYIEIDDVIDDRAGVYGVKQFLEKPNEESASAFCRSGQHYWNAGFVFGVGVYLSELEKHVSVIALAAAQAMAKAVKDLDFIRPNANAMMDCPNIAVDYAVMEKSTQVALKPIHIEWSDVGNWESLYQVSQKDANNNAISGDVLLEDVSNALLRSDDKLLVIKGLKDVVVVNTPDAVFVADRKQCVDIKSIVSALNAKKRKETKRHTTVYRPWGHYTDLSQGEGFKVKRLVVKPGAVLSLKSHEYRSEHWVVVSGKASVRSVDNEYTWEPGVSMLIPRGEEHQIKNESNCHLVMIEVQVCDVLNAQLYAGYNDQVQEEVGV